MGPGRGDSRPLQPKKGSSLDQVLATEGSSDGFVRGCGEPALHPQENQECGMHSFHVPEGLHSLPRQPSHALRSGIILTSLLDL